MPLNHLLTPHLDLSKHYKYPYKGVKCAYTPSQCYPYSKVLPLPYHRKVQPLILIGDNCTYLITAKEPIKFGHNSKPPAVLIRCTDSHSILPKEHLGVMDQTLNLGRCSLSERPLLTNEQLKTRRALRLWWTRRWGMNHDMSLVT